MSLRVDIGDSSKAVQELLKGVVEWMRESDSKQQVFLNLSLRFRQKKKKDC